MCAPERPRRPFIRHICHRCRASPSTGAALTRLTLDAAITEALEKNLDLIATRAGVTIAEANLITAQLRPNPVLSLGGDHLDFLGTGFDEQNGAGPPEYSVRVTFSSNAAPNALAVSAWRRKSAQSPSPKS